MMNMRAAEKNGEAAKNGRLPFVLMAVVAFCLSAAATAYFCHSMSGGMQMPGGWTMSMMWMRMAGQTWAASSMMFLLMWLAMMVAMMLPSAMPAFLRSQRSDSAEALPGVLITAGYFGVWMVAGMGVYALGIAFAIAAMRWGPLSRVEPAISGAMLVAAGAFQFTPWKMSGLARCRDPLSCAISKKPFLNGWRQGVACLVCCSGLMLALLVLGAMNLGAMAVVTFAITLEKLGPKPEWSARVSGAAMIIAGIFVLTRALLAG